MIRLRRRPWWRRVLRSPQVFGQIYAMQRRTASRWQSLHGAWLLTRLLWLPDRKDTA